LDTSKNYVIVKEIGYFVLHCLMNILCSRVMSVSIQFFLILRNSIFNWLF